MRLRGFFLTGNRNGRYHLPHNKYSPIARKLRACIQPDVLGKNALRFSLVFAGLET